ncbi:MAG: type II toxin-antitoxin system mRNA interferase toxin, RelE/StbE family [Arcobacteraceae bacterium]
MTYSLEFHPNFKKDLKNLDKKVAVEVRDIHLGRIYNNPFENPKLKGDLDGVYSYHFKSNNTQYRIAYSVENEEIIFYYMVAKRENFYKQLTNRI